MKNNINLFVKLQSKIFCNFSVHNYVKPHMNVTNLYTIQSIHFCSFRYLIENQFFIDWDLLEFYVKKSRYVANLYTILLVENLSKNIREKCGQNRHPLFAKRFNKISTFIFCHILPPFTTLFHNKPPIYI